MPIICAGTQLLRKSSTKSDRDVCDAFVTAVNGALAARNEVQEGKPLLPLSAVATETVRGNDMSLLVVLQRELGAVAPSEYNPISKCCLQSRVCSIDATTCTIMALRDPYSGTTVVGHFDQGGDQVDESVPAMLMHLPPKPVVAEGLMSPEERNDTDGLFEAHKVKRVVQLYLVGSVKYPRFSAENLAGLLRFLADDMDVAYDVRLDGTCVWSQNLAAGGKGLIHRGLMVDSKSGKPTPVQCNKERAYPAGRLRSLRFFDTQDKRLSSVTLMPGETVSTASPVDEEGVRKALHFVLMVRPFKFPQFSVIVARKPADSFAAMSTSPEMEPADFGEMVKSSVVFASLTSPEKVFSAHPRNPRVPSPVAFQLTIGKGAVALAEAAAAEEAEAEAGAEAAKPAAASGELAFSWVQISPPRATDEAEAAAAATAPSAAAAPAAEAAGGAVSE